MVNYTKTKKNNHFIALDILRIFAAIIVVLFHFFYRGPYLNENIKLPIIEFAKYGYLGVNLFFILSGFLIAQSLNKKSRSLFMLKRFIRIYPAYFLCLFITIFAKFIFTDVLFSLEQICSNILLVNWLFKIPSIDGVYWSLHIEILFYFLMAAFWIYSKSKGKTDLFLLIWLFTSVYLNFFPSHHFILKILRIITLGEYSGYFIIGILFYRLHFLGLKKHLFLLCFLCFLFCVKTTYEEAKSLVNLSVDPIIASFLLIIFMLIFPIIPSLRLTINSKVVSVLAGATYPLYLVHQELGYIIIESFNLSTIFSGLLLLVLILTFSVLLNQKLEIPIQKKISDFF